MNYIQQHQENNKKAINASFSDKQEIPVMFSKSMIDKFKSDLKKGLVDKTITVPDFNKGMYDAKNLVEYIFVNNSGEESCILVKGNDSFLQKHEISRLIIKAGQPYPILIEKSLIFSDTEDNLEKAIKNLTTLQKKIITNKAGHQQTVYVRVHDDKTEHHFTNGDKVKFEHKGKQVQGEIKSMKHHEKFDPFGTVMVHDAEGNKYSKSLRAIEHHNGKGILEDVTSKVKPSDIKVNGKNIPDSLPEVGTTVRMNDDSDLPSSLTDLKGQNLKIAGYVNGTSSVPKYLAVIDKDGEERHINPNYTIPNKSKGGYSSFFEANENKFYHKEALDTDLSDLNRAATINGEGEKNYLDKLPIVSYKKKAKLSNIEITNPNKPFIFSSPDGRFFVDPQGYDYPRYIIKLKYDSNPKAKDNTSKRISDMPIISSEDGKTVITEKQANEPKSEKLLQVQLGSDLTKLKRAFQAVAPSEYSKISDEKNTGDSDALRVFIKQWKNKLKLKGVDVSTLGLKYNEVEKSSGKSTNSSEEVTKGIINR